MIRRIRLHVFTSWPGLAMAALALGICARLQAQTIDPAFNPDYNWSAGDCCIRKILPAPGGNYYVLRGYDIQRVSAQGLRDTSYEVGASSDIDDAAVQPDGKLVIVGAFDSVRLVDRIGVARINVDGTVDPAFNANLQSSSAYHARVFLQPNGAILLSAGSSGEFGLPAGGSSPLVRLSSTGVVDTGLQLDPDLTNQGAAIALPDGGILWRGEKWDDAQHTSSSDWAGVLGSGGGMAQALPDLVVLDGIDVNASAQSADGKIIIHGLVPASPANTAYNFFGKLAPTLTIDYGFQPDQLRNFSASNNFVDSQPDGTTLFTGYYRWSNEVSGSSSNRLGRVLANGGRDGAWVEPVFNDYTDSILLQSDGSVVIGGPFTSVNGVPRMGLARILPPSPYDPVFKSGFE